MPREDLKLAVVATALSPDPRSAPLLARKAGFKGLQFEAKSASLDIVELSGTGQREFVRTLSAQDQQLVGLRHDLGQHGFGPGADVDRELSRLLKIMEAATRTGSPLICIDVGPLPEPVVTEPPRPKISPELAGMILLPSKNDVPAPQPATRKVPPPDPNFISQVDSALVELGRLADRTSTIVAFRAELASISAIERALRAADCPWFGLDLDPAAIVGDELEIDEVFARLGPAIRHVRGRDALGGASGRTRPAIVGQGSTDWPLVLANLSESDYQGWITIDPIELPDRPAAALAAARYLETLG